MRKGADVPASPLRRRGGGSRRRVGLDFHELVAACGGLHDVVHRVGVAQPALASATARIQRHGLGRVIVAGMM